MEPPPIFRAFDPNDRMAQVDYNDHDPEQDPTATPSAPTGRRAVRSSIGRASRATAAAPACSDRCEQNGWPGGLTPLDLLREALAMHQRSA